MGSRLSPPPSATIQMRSFHVGEAVIDFASAGDLRFQGRCGGSPLNTAIAVSRLGQAAGYITQLSNDLFGQRLHQHVLENGLDTRFLLRHDAPTTLAFVEHGEHGNRYQFLANGSADFLYDPDPTPVLPEDTAFLQFGSVSMVLEPSASSIERLVQAHRERVIVVFDPNVRPTVIPDMAAFKQRSLRQLAMSHIIKLSDEDAALLCGDRVDAGIAHWLTLGPQAIFLTQGARGARLYRRHSPPLDQPSPQVQVADTVGAGDTFTAGLITALMECGVCAPGQLPALPLSTWQFALRQACNAAALCCTRAGANPPTRAELNTLP